jgi:hypothetical protein
VTTLPPTYIRGVQEVPKTLGRFVEGNHEGGAVKLFIGKIQEGNNAKIVSVSEHEVFRSRR